MNNTWHFLYLIVTFAPSYLGRGAAIISIFSEWITMRKKERNSCRNQLKVILIGWERFRKKRYCHSLFNNYGVLLVRLGDCACLFYFKLSLSLK